MYSYPLKLFTPLKILSHLVFYIWFIGLPWGVFYLFLSFLFFHSVKRSVKMCPKNIDFIRGLD